MTTKAIVKYDVFLFKGEPVGNKIQRVKTWSEEEFILTDKLTESFEIFKDHLDEYVLMEDLAGDYHFSREDFLNGWKEYLEGIKEDYETEYLSQLTVGAFPFLQFVEAQPKESDIHIYYVGEKKDVAELGDVFDDGFDHLVRRKEAGEDKRG